MQIIRILKRIIFGVPLFLFYFCLDLLNRLRSPSNQVAGDVKEHGIHVFSQKIPLKEVHDLLEDFNLRKNFGEVEGKGQLSGRVYSHGVLTPLFKKYVDLVIPYVSEILNSRNVKVEISYYQESFPKLQLDDVPGGEFHVDDNRANLKFFIYLSDVGPNNGPFSCVPRTGGWRLRWSFLRGLLMEITRHRRYEYDFMLNYQDLEKNEIKVCGSAGTCFLVDTTTVHRAQPLLEGIRKVAVISFNRASVLGV